MLRNNKFKKGVASFYIVAISTLVLVIISASFAAVIISELARTSNDDLAQSAYDSAMAGVEDAKLAYYNYNKCLASGQIGDCAKIKGYMENPDCDMVAHILGRLPEGESGEVLIKETTNGDNKMAQAYTCVKINKNPPEYSISAGEGVTTSVAKVGLDGEHGTANDVESLRVELEEVEGSSLSVMALGMIQTTVNFTLEDFDMTKDGQTNRGTVFLVPYTNEDEYRGLDDSKVNKAYSSEGGVNIIKADGLSGSNDKVPENKPFAIYCGDMSGGKRCEVVIELPKPVGWQEGDEARRSDDTFMIIRTTYGRTKADIEFCKESAEEGGCARGKEESSSETESSLIPTSGMQVTVDSTGRANDLFRRVEAVLEDTSAVSGMALGLYNAVQADNIYKIESALCEAKFINQSNCAQ